MLAALVTAEALSSMESCTRSCGSSTCRTRVSVLRLVSALEDYCTLLKSDCTENSRRMRTQAAVMGSDESSAPCPAWISCALSERLERPRATSKSGLNRGCLGTCDNAAAISFCSSAEGVHTFSTLTLTGERLVAV